MQVDKTVENLEEYMNIVMSKCRSKNSSRQIMHNPQTNGQHQLGKKIRKLPERALDRVVEILQPSNLSAKDLPERYCQTVEAILPCRACGEGLQQALTASSMSYHGYNFCCDIHSCNFALSSANDGTTKSNLCFGFNKGVKMSKKNQ